MWILYLLGSTASFVLQHQSFPVQEVFMVDPATGSVTVAKSLDRTVATEVTLAVTVTDVSAMPPQVCIYLVVIYRACATLVWFCLRIYIFSSLSLTCTFFAIITSCFSTFQVSLLHWGKLHFKQIPFMQLSCPAKYPAFHFHFDTRFFLSVSS